MNTRTEITRPFTNVAAVNVFSVQRLNGFNEIKWTSVTEQHTERYVVEYSTDGVNFQTAGELVPSGGNYQLRHHIFETQPLLYRIKTTGPDSRYSYSKLAYLEGEQHLPVKVYPTVITGNIVNAVADFPVEHVTITAANGLQVLRRSVGGRDNYLSIPIPTSLSKGMYWISFTGNGWQTTSKFIIQ